MIRRPAVAGTFYPRDPGELRAAVEASLAAAPPAEPAVGAVSPHAGYMYSGGVAGAVLGAVEVTETVLLLGPNHTGAGTAASLAPPGGWATPLGTAEVDADLAAALADACPLLRRDAAAHAREHSLEVQLPFLQVRRPGVRIVPIAFMLRRFEEIEQVGQAIAGVLATWPAPVLTVASSDMTHYESRDAAARKDRLAIARVEALDARGLAETVAEHRISMCGVIPTAVLLAAAPALGASRGELVRYATSGDVTGDHRQVVGYAGLAIR